MGVCRGGVCVCVCVCVCMCVCASVCGRPRLKFVLCLCFLLHHLLWAWLGVWLQAMEVSSKLSGSSVSSYSRKRPSAWEYSSEPKRAREDEVSLGGRISRAGMHSQSTPSGSSTDT